MKKNKGFTLLEIIVCLVIIGSFLAIFGPSISDLFKHVSNLDNIEESYLNTYNAVRFATAADLNTDNTVNPDNYPEYKNIVRFTEFTPPTSADDNNVRLYSIDYSTDTNGVKTKVTSYSPTKIIVYYATYKSGRFGSENDLYYNDYKIVQ